MGSHIQNAGQRKAVFWERVAAMLQGDPSDSALAARFLWSTSRTSHQIETLIFQGYVRGFITKIWPKIMVQWYGTSILGSWNSHWSNLEFGDLYLPNVQQFGGCSLTLLTYCTCHSSLPATHTCHTCWHQNGMPQMYSPSGLGHI